MTASTQSAISGYDPRSARAYRLSRELDSSGLEGWRNALSPHLAHLGNTAIIDLGAGTGAFARTISEWFSLRVVAIEPSEAMWRVARQRKPSPGVCYVAARAQALPFRMATFAAVWLSTVIHQIADLRECARQLRHVLRPQAVVLIRSAFGDRLDDITMFRYFPEAKQVATSFPTVQETLDACAVGGFVFESLESVPQVSSLSLQEFRRGLPTLRLADSTLRRLSDEAFQRGLQLMERDLAGGNNGPVVDRLDLLVLRRAAGDDRR